MDQEWFGANDMLSGSRQNCESSMGNVLPDIYRKIIFAKYLLERAAGLQREANDASVSVSLLLMHDAAELLMLAIVDHLQVTVQKRREFMDFWTEIKPPTHPSPPDRLAMESMNKMRVVLKHNGNLPNAQEVRNLLPRVRGFFENVLKAYCDLEYTEVSLLDLIENQQVKDYVVSARQKFAISDRIGAMTDLQFALHYLENPDGKRLPKLYAPKRPSLPSEMVRGGWGVYLDQLHDFLSQCASRTNALMFGIDPLRYSRFTGLGPSVQWSITGAPYVLAQSDYRDLPEEVFEEQISFLTDYAIKASESYVPSAVRNAIASAQPTTPSGSLLDGS
jgi:hypothetical protein